MRPQARQDRLVVQKLDDETVIYDEQRNHIHRLNQTATLVWQHCDGQRTIKDLAGVLEDKLAAPVTDDIVWLALDRLEKEHLLHGKLVRPDETRQITRRDVLRKVAIAGGMTLMLPVIQSMVAPTPAMAFSVGCTGPGHIPTATKPCCPGLRMLRGRCFNGEGNPPGVS